LISSHVILRARIEKFFLLIRGILLLLVKDAEGMIGILFTQCMMDSPEPPRIFTDFWTLA
jgi:hypothetical protein